MGRKNRWPFGPGTLVPASIGFREPDSDTIAATVLACLPSDLGDGRCVWMNDIVGVQSVQSYRRKYELAIVQFLPDHE